jgi:phage tail-like protein
MDVNQTRFHLVYGQADWLPAATVTSPVSEPLLDWNFDDATLGLHQVLFLFPRHSGQLALGVENRRGAGQDRYGNWYFIDTSRRELRFRGAKQKSSEHFWSAADRQPSCPARGEFFDTAPTSVSPLNFSGLAVTPNHYLVAGVLSPKGLLVFDLYAGGPPQQFLWPSAIPFEPFDMSITADGGLVILDRTSKLYWSMDPDLRVQATHPLVAPAAQAEAFQPATAAPSPVQTSCVPTLVTLDFATSLSSLSDPVAIAALPDGSVLILDNPAGSYFSDVHRFQSGVEVGPPIHLDTALANYASDTPSPDYPHPQSIRAYDFAFVGNSLAPGARATLYLADIFGEQCFACDLSISGNTLSLAVRSQYFPMRKFGGKALVSAQSAVYYDFEDIWYPLVEQPQQQYRQQAQLLLPQQPSLGQALSGPFAFDGKLPACIWHRLFLDACIPHGASVQVESRAADILSLLPDTPWQSEPTPYLRSDGPEIPYLRSLRLGPSDRAGTWELLFQRAQGRYLQLRLTIRGTARNTPRLRALRVYYPRFSYLRQYMPAVYRDDAVSASFLDRFLANVEGFYTVFEDKIANVQELFDSRLVPAECLDWLASWFSLDLDPIWNERTRRLVLSHALQMFRERGTPNGIIRAIRLLTDSCPDESLFDDSLAGNLPCTGTNCSRKASASIFSVRLVERFLTRVLPTLTLEKSGSSPNSTALAAASDSNWAPAQGSEPLHVRYRCFLQNQYSTIEALNQAWSTNYSEFVDAALLFPAIQPAQSSQAQDWIRFLLNGLGFTYAPVASPNITSYRAFLAQRYRTIAELNSAYSLAGSAAWSSFSSISLPSILPANGPQLLDWILFASVYLPAAQTAHRFTVLVPVALGECAESQQTKLAIAKRIAEIEKPAHTSFDVQLYWGMFRAGEARLGRDTLLGPGSRFAGLVLGQGYLAGGNLAPVEPIYAKDRMRLGSRPANSRCSELRSQEKCP